MLNLQQNGRDEHTAGIASSEKYGCFRRSQDFDRCADDLHRESQQECALDDEGSASSNEIVKWSDIKESVDVLKMAVPDLLHQTFVANLYLSICQSVPEMSQYYEQQCLEQKNKKEKGFLSCKIEEDNRKEQRKEQKRLKFQAREYGNQDIPIDLDEDQLSYHDEQRQYDQGSTVNRSLPEDYLVKTGQILVQIFCSQGYSIRFFQEELAARGYSVIDSRLNCQQLMRVVIKNAFLKLDQFLKEECQLQIASLKTQFGEKDIIDSMLRCRQNYSQKCCDTLYSIIKGQCGLSQEAVTEFNALKLYEQIEKDVSARVEKRQSLKQEDLHYQPPQNNIGPSQPLQLPKINPYPILVERHRKMRNVLPRTHGGVPPKQIEEVRKLNRVWNSRYENQMIYYYRQDKNIAWITEFFKQKYPADQASFSTVAIRSALYKLLRQAVRKLFSIIEKYGNGKLPFIKAVDHNQVRAMVYNNNGLQVRKHLLDVYTLTNYDQRIIAETINGMNQYLNVLQKEFRRQELMKMLEQEERQGCYQEYASAKRYGRYVRPKGKNDEEDPLMMESFNPNASRAVKPRSRGSRDQVDRFSTVSRRRV